MAYVIAEPCIGKRYSFIVDVCPVDCIHPRGQPAFEAETQLYIHPTECIDCGACPFASDRYFRARVFRKVE
jgi:ferredoxin